MIYQVTKTYYASEITQPFTPSIIPEAYQLFETLLVYHPFYATHLALASPTSHSTYQLQTLCT